jgi:hypothetical protein
MRLDRAVTLIQSLLTIVFFNSYQFCNAQAFINKAEEFGVVAFGAGIQGSGCSTFDWDEDGYDDLTLLSMDSVPMFFHNDGGNGFTRVYFEGIEIADTIMMVTWVDIDNDGDKDLAFNIYQGGPRLYRNNGDFVFEDVTQQSGIIMTEDHWGYGLNWGDIDLDGDLDLYVANYNWASAPPGSDLLYKNNGNFTFSLINQSAGIAFDFAPTFQGVWLDYDLDLDPDLIVANDREAYTNLLYRNNGNGQFTNHTAQTNFTHFICSMCATVGDYDNDGRYDVYFTNTPFAGNRLFKFSDELNYFQEVAGELGVLLFQYSWGSTWFDYDNDGWQDLYVGTEIYPALETNTGADYLLRNTPNGFEWQFDAGFENYLGITNALSRADFNNDGFPDLLTHSQAPLGTGIWYNQLTQGNYLKIMPKGVISNKDGVGVRMELYTETGNQYRYTLCGEQYISQNTQWQHFGLANLSKADSLILKWPSGHIDTFYDIDANQSLTIYEGSSIVNEITVLSGSLAFCEGGQVLLDGGEWQSYNWSTGDTTRTIWVNETEIVSLQVFDGTFFIDAAPLTIQVLETLADTVLITSPGCAGESNGMAEIVPHPVLNNVQVVWWDGLTGLTHSNLAEGNYTAIMTAFAGAACYDSILVTIQNPPIFLFDSVSLAYNGFPGECENTWFATPYVTGGTPPWTFEWELREIGEETPFLIETALVLDCIPSDRDLDITCKANDSGTCSEIRELVSKSAVGINSLDSQKLKIYPNPSEGKLIVEGCSNRASIELFNLRGQIIASRFQFSDAGNIAEIELQESYSGAAILLYKDQNRVVRQVLIIQH